MNTDVGGLAEWRKNILRGKETSESTFAQFFLNVRLNYMGVFYCLPRQICRHIHFKLMGLRALRVITKDVTNDIYPSGSVSFGYIPPKIILHAKNMYEK